MSDDKQHKYMNQALMQHSINWWERHGNYDDKLMQRILEKKEQQQQHNINSTSTPKKCTQTTKERLLAFIFQRR